MTRIACFVLCSLFLCPTNGWAQSTELFILHSYGQEYPWTKDQHQGFVDELKAAYPHEVLISTEYLDTKRVDFGPSYIGSFRQYLAMKYAGYRPDVVYVTDDNALTFAINELPEIFPDVPIVFSGVNDYSALTEGTAATGVFEKKEITPNLRVIRHIGFNSGQIAFVGDGSETDRAIKREIARELEGVAGIQPVFIDSPSIDTISDALAQHPYGIVFLTTIGGVKDRDGQVLAIREIVRRIVAGGDFLLLSMEDAYIVPGVLGGYVTSGVRQGQVAARMVSAYLSGTGVEELGPVRTGPNEFVFDQRELDRHDLVLPDAIQQEATILHPHPSFYETHRTLVVTSLLLLAFLLVATLLLSIALMFRKSRELREAADALRERNAQLVSAKASLDEAQRIATMGSWSLRLDSGQLEWSDEIFNIFEVDKNQFKASYEAFLAAIHPDDRDRVNEAFHQSVRDKSPYEIQHRLKMADGRIKFVLERGSTYYNEEGIPVRSVGTVQDISERVKAEQRLKQWAAVFENSLEGVVITDERAKIIDVNRAFVDITGYSKEEVLGGRPNIRRSQCHDREFYRAMWQSIQDTGSWSGEIWNRKKSGELSPEWLSISTLYDDSEHVTNYVGVFTDISVLKRSEEKLEYLANHDPLTNLPNRNLLHERLNQAIAHAKRNASMIAVLFLDLDRFKIINDTLGHIAGDKLLRAAAERMRIVLRECDTIGRQGGDEFVAIIEGCRNIDEIEALSDRIRETLTQRFEIDGQTLFIGVSIGICLFPADGRDAATLIRNADSAMYQAKRAGRNGHVFYDPQLTDKARMRMELDVALRGSVEKGEFQLYYQPKVDLASGALIGAEALVRWQRGEQLVNPDEFIPIAEETGVILAIGEWVLEESARQLHAWREAGYSLQQLAINLSAVQVERGHVADIMRRLLDQFALPASLFEMEITESVLFDHPEQAERVLAELRDIGLSLAMDDFGTGFSSLINLKRYPIDTIKIDRSFVRDLMRDANDEAITRAVIAMCKSLELTVVAEGVEESAQAVYLKAHGCHQAQGHLFGHPVPAEAFEKLLEAGGSRGGGTKTALQESP